MLDAMLRHPEAHIEASAILFNIILIIFSARQTRQKTEETRAFRRLTTFSMIIIYTEVSRAWMGDMQPNNWSYYLLNTTNLFSYLFVMLYGFGLITYLSLAFNKKVRKGFRIFEGIFLAVYAFFIVRNMWDGCVSLYSFEEHRFLHGPLYWPIGIGMPFFAYVCGLVFFITNLKNLRPRSRYTMYMAGVLMVVGMVAQPLLGNIFTLSGLMTSLVLFVIYLSLETEDYAQLMDMTESLERAREEALAANEAKSTFLANMSHEIRTPLNAFMGLNEMILKESHDFATIDHARDMRQAGDALLTIINQVLDISKIETGNIDFVEAQYHLSDMLADVEIIIGSRVKDKGLTYIAEVDQDLPDTMVGDCVRIRQILVNVLNNSVKYTNHGVVVLCVRGDFEDDNRVVMKVQIMDTGIGIKEEDMKNLFETYKRVNEDETKGVEGTGIGLSIVKSFVENMGGSIGVESNYGMGTMTYITIPQKYVKGETIRDISNREIETRLDDTVTAFDGSGKKILVVDDNEMNIKVVEGFLKDTGVHVTTAGGGREALAILKIKKFDLILLDAFMPVVDGPEVFRTIREDEHAKNHDTPCVVLTADALSGSEKKYMDMGFDAYLPKPVEADRLNETVRNFLRIEKKAENIQEDLYEGGEEDIVLDPSAIDAEEGLNACGDIQDYKDHLRSFVSQWQGKSVSLKKYLDAGDFKQFVIAMHGVKTSSRAIGAYGLGEEADRLEVIAKAAMKGEDLDKNEEILINETPKFLSIYEKVAKQAGEMIDG
ncbi:MAG: response regulator [Lachnospiraceae bacterium]|nr:response regulator [Lachnospiraceae bacterium]